MEPNVDRGMWSVVALLAAIVIGGVVLLAFPRISGKIVSNMDDTVNKAFNGETPDWVNPDNYLTNIERYEKIQKEFINPDNIYQPKEGVDVFHEITYISGPALTYEGTGYFISNNEILSEKGWHVVDSGNLYADHIFQIIDVRDFSRMELKLKDEVVIYKPNGHGKIFGLNENLVFKDRLIKSLRPKEPDTYTVDLNDVSYVVMQIPAPESNYSLVFSK